MTGSYTTLTDELAAVERYVTLERTRLGERLAVRLRIAPEVLSVVLPYLALQKLVENAVRNGLEPKPNGGTVEIIAENAGAECLITVEDDGVGMEVTAFLTEPATTDLSSMQALLSDVDRSMRGAFGDDQGLIVDTAPACGMKVTLRVPKFRRGVRV